MSDEVQETAEAVADVAETEVASAAEVEAAPAVVETAPAAAPAPAAVAEPADEGRTARKVREGVVVSNKMNQTAVVAIVERVRHAKYGKFVNRTKKLYAHDEANDVNIGDRVTVMETRPMSKLKRWRITEVLERAK